MTKSFRDYDRENDLEEGRKEGKLELLTSMIKEGILTLKQAADKMNMTIFQFENSVNNLLTEYLYLFFLKFFRRLKYIE